MVNADDHLACLEQCKLHAGMAIGIQIKLPRHIVERCRGVVRKVRVGLVVSGCNLGLDDRFHQSLVPVVKNKQLAPRQPASKQESSKQ